MPSAKLIDHISENMRQNISLKNVPSNIRRGMNVRVILTGRVVGLSDQDEYSNVSLEASNVEFEPLTMDDADAMAQTRPMNPFTSGIHPGSKSSGDRPTL